MSSVPASLLTAAEYLKIERQADFKSEFFRGEMFAMSGASLGHNRISVNLLVAIGAQLRGGPCEELGSNMRVHVTATGLYTYPDLVVITGDAKFEDEHVDTLLTPKVLFEILSDSTEKYDRGTKAAHYRQIPSLQEYAFVSQYEPRIEVYQRLDTGDWLLSEAQGLEAEITFRTLGITLPLAEIYRRVEFKDQNVVNL